VDAVIGAGGMPLPSAKELALLEPLGEANEEPLFLLRGAAVEDRRVVGQGHLKLGLRVGGRSISAFGWELGALVDRADEIDGLLGSLRPDSYRGGDAVELRISALLRGDEVIGESG
jgi:single-stranded-DNA-specific exonuclease